MAHLNPCVKSIMRVREISSKKRKSKLVDNQFGGGEGEMKRRKKKVSLCETEREKEEEKNKEKKAFDFRYSNGRK